MHRLTPWILPVLAAAAVALPAQKRATEQEQPTFERSWNAAREHWNAGRYGACNRSVTEALGLVAVKRAQVLRAAFPAAPEGWTIEEDRSNEEAAANPLLGAMAATAGTTIRKVYNQTETRARMDVTLTADSPMVQMVGMMFGNAAMLPKGTELIEYEAHKAMLKKQGEDRWELMIMIADKHICQVNARGMSDDALFAVWDQAAVDRLAKALED